MKKLSYEDLLRVRNQKDMIEGNINRMCVTDDLAELDTMAHHAKERIKLIRELNYKRLTEADDE